MPARSAGLNFVDDEHYRRGARWSTLPRYGGYGNYFASNFRRPFARGVKELYNGETHRPLASPRDKYHSYVAITAP